MRDSRPNWDLISLDLYKKVLDYDISGNLIYIGVAKPGVLKSSADWQIKKLVYDGSNNLTDVLFADGNTEFDNIWDDRTSIAIDYL